MDEYFLKIATELGVSPCEVERMFKIFAKIQNDDYEQRGENDEQSPIAILQDWIDAQEAK